MMSHKQLGSIAVKGHFRQANVSHPSNIYQYYVIKRIFYVVLPRDNVCCKRLHFFISSMNVSCTSTVVCGTKMALSQSPWLPYLMPQMLFLPNLSSHQLFSALSSNISYPLSFPIPPTPNPLSEIFIICPHFSYYRSFLILIILPTSNLSSCQFIIHIADKLVIKHSFNLVIPLLKDFSDSSQPTR